MSLLFYGPRGELEQRWIAFALLRDNVRHHLEQGVPTSEFAEIHRAAAALGGRRIVLSAARLRAELQKAQSLMQRPISELAISTATRAALDGTWPPPESESTALIGADRRAVPWLRAAGSSLDAAFGNLIRGLLDITEGAQEGDAVEVKDL
jgi:hypothetical protein